MASVTQRLIERGLIRPPAFLASNMQYEVMTGSVSYGVSSEDKSDVDIVGFCIPTKELIFPHLAGEIPGFGRQTQRFEQFQQHHVDDQEARKNYDLTVYSIVRFFQLCMDNNPNMIDSLFVPNDCVLFITQIGQMVRENRKLFLHKGAYHKLKGYCFSQLHKMSDKNPEPGSKRAKDIETHGFDTKYAYHLLRLLNECQQILETGDLDLRANREQLKACRRGEISEVEIRHIFTEQERVLEKLYNESKLQYSPDEPKIKQLLLNCLEQHYGNLSNAIVKPDVTTSALRDILKIAENALR
jgi:uncharacterized protein